MRIKLTLLLLLSLTATSCRFLNSFLHNGEQIVARVGDQKLYLSELEHFIPEDSTPEDSLLLSRRYINSWAMDKLYMHVASEQLSKDELDVSEELEAYRRSLVKYRYEQRYVSDRLDTLVTDEQISEYYEAHKKDFTLKSPVLKVRFADIMKDSPSLVSFLKMMSSDDYETLQRADTLSKSVTLKYIDNSDIWMDASDLAREFSLGTSEMLSLMKNSMIKYAPEDRGDLLVAYVCDIRTSGPAPVEYCSAEIRNILLSERKHALVKGLEQDLLDNALETGLFEVY